MNLILISSRIIKISRLLIRIFLIWNLISYLSFYKLRDNPNSFIQPCFYTCINFCFYKYGCLRCEKCCIFWMAIFFYFFSNYNFFRLVFKYISILHELFRFFFSNLKVNINIRLVNFLHTYKLGVYNEFVVWNFFVRQFHIFVRYIYFKMMH